MRRANARPRPSDAGPRSHSDGWTRYGARLVAIIVSGSVSCIQPTVSSTCLVECALGEDLLAGEPRGEARPVATPVVARCTCASRRRRAAGPRSSSPRRPRVRRRRGRAWARSGRTGRARGRAPGASTASRNANPAPIDRPTTTARSVPFASMTASASADELGVRVAGRAGRAVGAAVAAAVERDARGSGARDTGSAPSSAREWMIDHVGIRRIVGLPSP